MAQRQLRTGGKHSIAACTHTLTHMLTRTAIQIHTHENPLAKKGFPARQQHRAPHARTAKCRGVLPWYVRSLISVVGSASKRSTYGGQVRAGWVGGGGGLTV